ncbi:hypothetical protein [Amycolatopsis sp. NPDC051372]|uniref:hypothetical protein n=1 Tax=Amycolatopsis sp. NPDC051372 TaxID=3155669 RepID=UPI003417A45F
MHATGAPVGDACLAIVDPTRHGSVSSDNMSCAFGTGTWFEIKPGQTTDVRVPAVS